MTGKSTPTGLDASPEPESHGYVQVTAASLSLRGAQPEPGILSLRLVPTVGGPPGPGSTGAQAVRPVSLAAALSLIMSPYWSRWFRLGSVGPGQV